MNKKVILITLGTVVVSLSTPELLAHAKDIEAFAPHAIQEVVKANLPSDLLTSVVPAPFEKLEIFFHELLEGATRLSDWVALLMFFKAGILMFQGEKEKSKQQIICIFLGMIIIRYAPMVLEGF